MLFKKNMSDTTNYITPEGFKKLQEEFRQLFHDERPKLVETVAWAAGNGNRSALKLCRRSTGYRCLIFTILFIVSLAAYNYTQTWLRPNALILVYLIFSYHQDHVLQLINRQRRP